MSIEQLSAKLRAAPQNTETWYDLGIALIEATWAKEVMDLVQMRQQMFEDGLAFFYQLLFKADQPAQKLKVSALAAEVPHDSLLSIVSEFFAGCIALQQEKTEIGFTKLAHSAERAAAQANLFMDDDHLSNIIAQQFAIFPPETVASLPSNTSPENLPPLNWEGAPGSPPLVFFTACNGLYFKRFGRTFIDTFSGYGKIHIHIADPLPEQRATLEGVLAEGVSLSTEEPGKLASAHYFACMRFLRAMEISQKFRSPLAILDIDFNAVARLLPLLETSQDSDICYFRTGCVMPWIDHHAAYFYLANTPAAYDYAGRLGGYVQSSLERGFWGLDQAAMSALYHYYLERPGQVRINALQPQDGYLFDEHFMVCGSTEEKWAMRHKAKDGTAR